MSDAVLQHGHSGIWAAEPGEPRRAGRRVVRLGAQQNPVARLCLAGIGQGAHGNVNRALRPLDNEPLDRAPDTGDDIVPVDRAQQTGDHAADAPETDDADRYTPGILNAIARCHEALDLRRFAVEPVSPTVLAEIAIRAGSRRMTEGQPVLAASANCSGVMP